MCIAEEPCEATSLTHGLRREARHHIPSAAGRHLKEVLELPAYPRSRDRRDSSMLDKARLSKDAVWQVVLTRPTW